RWQGKHDMKIRHIEKFAFPGLYPRFALMPLTGWAVSVSAAVVTKMELVAGRIVTAVDVSAHGGCAASAYGLQRARMPPCKSVRQYIILLHLQYISHLEVAAH